MALGLTVVGLGILEGNSPTLPDASAYNTIELYGDATFDSMWGRNESISEVEILAYTTATYLPIWTPSTYILARFENDLSMGNISGLTAPLLSWLIKRKDPDRSSLRTLAELPPTTIQFKDYQPILGNEYIYYIYAKTTNELSNPLISAPITPSYNAHFLIDVDNELSFKFDLNSTTTTFTTVDDYTEYATNLTHNAFSKGNRKFKEGSLQAIVRDENTDIVVEFSQPLVLLSALESTVALSTGTKYLKTRRGEIYKVFTYGYSQSQLNDNIPQQVYVSSFNFKEVGDVYGD